MNREVFCTHCLEEHNYNDEQCCVECETRIPDGIIDMSQEIVYLKEELENGNTVEFTYTDLYYEIFESANYGYVVNVYSSDDKDEYGCYLNENIFDGGLCTGSAEDAIRFMI